MITNNIEVRVLVKDRPINEYLHEGETFVEGRGGSNYEIEIVNLTNERVEAVLAVDGLSVIDGKEAGATSTGYLLHARERIRIPGWKLTDEQVAAFQFAGKKKSYAATTEGGSARNTGVIGVMTFKERIRAKSFGLRASGAPMFGSAGVMRGIAPGVGVTTSDLSYVAPATADAAHIYNMAVGSAANSFEGQWAETAASLTSGADLMKSADSTRSRRVQAVTLENTRPEFVEQTLGTAFGEATDFSTVEVEFDRGDLLAMSVLYYDDAKGLRARGIDLDRRKQNPRVKEQPQAFPGLNKGCTPPKGWRG